MKNTTKKIVIFAVITALTLVMGAIPFVFLIPMLFAAITFDFKTSIFAGFVYGFVSLMYAFLGSSFVSLAFISLPWIPVVPRVVTAMLCNLSFAFFKKCFKRDTKTAKVLQVAFAAAIGSILNTALVVSLLLLFAKNVSLEGITVFVYAPTMLISGLIELTVAIIVLPPLVLTVQKALLTANGQTRVINEKPKSVSEAAEDNVIKIPLKKDRQDDIKEEDK